MQAAAPTRGHALVERLLGEGMAKGVAVLSDRVQQAGSFGLLKRFLDHVLRSGGEMQQVVEWNGLAEDACLMENGLSLWLEAGEPLCYGGLHGLRNPHLLNRATSPPAVFQIDITSLQQSPENLLHEERIAAAALMQEHCQLVRLIDFP